MISMLIKDNDITSYQLPLIKQDGVLVKTFYWDGLIVVVVILIIIIMMMMMMMMMMMIIIIIIKHFKNARINRMILNRIRTR